MCCKSLKHVAYSDTVWQRIFREQWLQEFVYSSLGMLGVGEAYLVQRTCIASVQIFRFLSFYFYTAANLMTIYKWTKMIFSFLRLFPLTETSLFRSEAQRKENVLVPSSYDHSIRLWWKGSCQRCFKGHNGPVSTLSDKLLGGSSGKILASGGEDGTVCLWSLSSSGKLGHQTLKATLYWHEKPIKVMSVAGHKPSLLATIANDSKVRVWDTSASSAVRSLCCVGMTSVPGPPVDMTCHEALLYVAAGSSVVTIDLRTMQKVITAAICQPKLHSFAIMPSKSLICTGGVGKAMLLDTRRSQEMLKPHLIAQLYGHTGPVTQ